MSDEERQRLDQQLASVGIDRLLADQATGFDFTVGGTVDRRVYAGEWLSRAIRRRDNTRSLMGNDKKAFRRAVMEKAYELTEEGKNGYTVTAEWVADEMEAEHDAVNGALDYLLRKGLLEAWGISNYGLTERGIDEIEDAREHPERPTANFPAIHVHQTNNNYGGTQAVSIGHHNTISQMAGAELPSELQTLASRLAALDGGSLSTESSLLLQHAAEGQSRLQIAASAEKVAEKGDAHKSLLSTFTEEITKELAKKGVEAGVGAVSWLHVHGSTLAAALAITFQHGR